MIIALPSSSAIDGRRAIIAAALMATYMEAVNISVPNAALPHIQGTLSMANDEVGWVFTAYMAAGAAVMPMARWLAGRYGRKAVYQFSIAIFALGLRDKAKIIRENHSLGKHLGQGKYLLFWIVIEFIARAFRCFDHGAEQAFFRERG